ncbi:MAG: hypothetical protein WBE17_18695 [Anaerolineae bacterium]
MIWKSVSWGDLFMCVCSSAAWYIKDTDHHLAFVVFGLLLGLMDSASHVNADKHKQKRIVNWFNINLISILILGLLGRYIPEFYGVAAGLTFCRATVLVWYQVSTRRIITWDDITA